jgi:hypothetical protein
VITAPRAAGGGGSLASRTPGLTLPYPHPTPAEIPETARLGRSRTGRMDDMSVTAFRDLPLAGRIRDWGGADDEPNQKYRDAHVWCDGDKKDNFTAYKLLIADVVGGDLKVVPRGVMAAAAIMDGARGGAQGGLPGCDRAGRGTETPAGPVAVASHRSGSAPAAVVAPPSTSSGHCWTTGAAARRRSLGRWRRRRGWTRAAAHTRVAEPRMERVRVGAVGRVQQLQQQALQFAGLGGRGRHAAIVPVRLDPPSGAGRPRCGGPALRRRPLAGSVRPRESPGDRCPARRAFRAGRSRPSAR